MKNFCLIVVVILIASMLCGCLFDEYDLKKLAITESERTEIIENQQKEMKSLYHEHKDLLNDIKDMLYENDDIKMIACGDSYDGYITFHDGSKKKLDDINPRIKSVCQLEGKTCDWIVVSGGTEKSGKVYLCVEAYYDKLRRMYRIEYSEKDLTQRDEWYSALGDGWFLWEATMT